MLVVDDIIVFPFKSLLMVFREIYNAAVQEMKQEGDRIRLELGQLYISLEAGNIDEATFDERDARSAGPAGRARGPASRIGG